ncbi:hypothetical protein [Idiomarina piscisalsi]|uniref:Uncharacterized protein n=1 Tax=Idiomarina piscisalsi TaxID=1096243 RepID=A0A432YX08_9GAMM|nr:hypothetical protein [Idiomarina piscisalsi]RUO67859.1 hypothetical protein CWI73_03085 [Idiomarina piscisalsi]
MKKITYSIILTLSCTLPCLAAEQEQKDDEFWLDGFRVGLGDTVDATALWFDGLFGDGEFEDDYRRSYGRLSVAPQWDEYDGFEVKSRFRARVALPNLEDNVSAFIGRVDDDEFLDEESTGKPSVIRSPESDREWLVGLGFDPEIHEGHRVSYSVGIRGGLRFDTYVRARYMTGFVISDKQQLKFQSAVFWRDSDGLGVSQRFNYESALDERWLLQWGALGTFAEETEGLRWSSTARLYHLYNEDKAWATETWIEGQTDHEVPISDYGLRLLNRQRYLREWFFVESWVGYHWPRSHLQEQRQGQWLVGIEFEVHFGTTNAYMPDAEKRKSNTNGSWSDER